jgi:hypothetical protein
VGGRFEKTTERTADYRNRTAEDGQDTKETRKSLPMRRQSMQADEPADRNRLKIKKRNNDCSNDQHSRGGKHQTTSVPAIMIKPHGRAEHSPDRQRNPKYDCELKRETKSRPADEIVELEGNEESKKAVEKTGPKTPVVKRARVWIGNLRYERAKKQNSEDKYGVREDSPKQNNRDI